ncbi:MAG: helix-turn-helix domain-containing protein [Chloroflexota bacterium]
MKKIICPKCGHKERQIKSGLTPSGSQRYLCKLCSCRYTPAPKESGYDEEVRLQALQLYLEGISLRKVSRILDVNHQSVANWVNDYANHLPPTLPESVLEQATLDGLHPWPFDKNKRSTK